MVWQQTCQIISGKAACLVLIIGVASLGDQYSGCALHTISLGGIHK